MCSIGVLPADVASLYGKLSDLELVYDRSSQACSDLAGVPTREFEITSRLLRQYETGRLVFLEIVSAAAPLIRTP